MAIPKLRLLKDEIKRFGLPGNQRSFQLRAMRLGACYQIGRGTFVTAEQLIQILESWVAYPPSNIRQPVEKKPRPVFIDHSAVLMARLGLPERDPAKRKKEANARRRKAMKEYWASTAKSRRAKKLAQKKQRRKDARLRKAAASKPGAAST